MSKDLKGRSAISRSWQVTEGIKIFRDPETPILNRSTGEPQPNIQSIEVKKGEDPELVTPSPKAVNKDKLNNYLRFCADVDKTVQQQVASKQAALEASQPAAKQTPRGWYNAERSWPQFLGQVFTGTLFAGHQDSNLKEGRETARNKEKQPNRDTI